MRFLSGIKKNKLMLFARNLMELGIIKLSRLRQTPKDKYCMFLSYMKYRFGKKFKT
jgi:hypothetical protein